MAFSISSPPRNRQLIRSLEEDQSELDISFDGDVEAIKRLALEKAQTEDIGASPQPDPFLCDGASSDFLHILTWTYSVEYESGSNEQEIVEDLEELLQLALKPRLLSCLNAEASSAGIVGEYALPLDEISDDTCEPKVAGNACQVYIGFMRLFLTGPDVSAQADYLGKSHIKSLMAAEGVDDSSISFLAEKVGKGLQFVTYLGPEPVVPSSANKGGDGGPFQTQDSSRTSIAVISAASAAFVVIIAGLIYRRRRRQEESDATYMAGSTNLRPYDTPGSPKRPSSPFSEMLPSAYRYSDNLSMISGNDSGLSAVMEYSGEEDNRSLNSDGILLSEGGYTTDAGDERNVSFDFPNSMFQNESGSGNLLGAKGLAHNPADTLFNSSASEGSASPQKPFAASSMFVNGALDSSMAQEDDVLLFL